MSEPSTPSRKRPRNAASKVAEQRLSVLELAKELGSGQNLSHVWMPRLMQGLSDFWC